MCLRCLKFVLFWATGPSEVLGHYSVQGILSNGLSGGKRMRSASPHISGCLQGGELNVLLQLPWVDADVIKKITRKGGARSVAELMGMDEQERLELLVTSGESLIPG